MVGAVLVGGASRRMGTTKAVLEVDGAPLARRAGDALAAGGCETVVLVGGDRAIGIAVGLTSIADDRPGEGPLAGLATALRWASSSVGADVVVVAAGDQPDLTGTLVHDLIAAVLGAPDEVVAAVPVSADGRHHPLPAAWRTTAATAVEELVVGGARRLGTALDLGAVEVVAPVDVLADLDTPEELAARRDRAPDPGP